MAGAIKDLDCINNLVKLAGENFSKGASKQGKVQDAVMIMIKETIKQLIERQDNKFVDEREYYTNELKSRDDRITKLESEARELRQQIDNVSQYNRRDNLKILGVPYNEAENVIDIVKKIALHTTGEALEDSEISVAHRLMSKNDKDDQNNTDTNGSRKKTTPSSIVKFSRRNTKTKIFDSRKETTKKPNAPYENIKMYEDVTPLRCRILYALRNKKDGDNKEFRYVWSREGRIYARKATEITQTPQPKPHIINRPEDLTKLGWTPEQIENIIYNKRD